MKVTFDKNVYEFIVNPNKLSSASQNEIQSYHIIRQAILDKRVIPFISETALTYETLAKKDRFQVLSNNKPLIIESKDSQIFIGPNPELHPGHHEKDQYYLTRAIDMGFKILSGHRFGKLTNPVIKNEWYYLLEEDYLDIGQRFCTVVQDIQNLGAGYRYFQTVIGAVESPHLNRMELMGLYKGSMKKLSEAIAEWSDGDSVALHITYGLDYFCTYDKGKSAGEKSVFGAKVYKEINKKYGFERISPVDLANMCIAVR